ncbi:hypothetical protein QJS10_CPB15g00844 [Acorus calamus]|uniref:Uncharacterized protein n=1 Tax=Acorus calamus TaxID=4465 RepID=A0AAV9D6H5_ACOCL|nr:hypothetical protein QJS10_CPB15g00844 [Acorus calamus]
MGDFIVIHWVEDRNWAGGITEDMHQFWDWIREVDGFREVVGDSWNLPLDGVVRTKKIALKLKRLKHTLKHWSHEAKKLRLQRKSSIALEISMLDALEECGLLENEERETKNQLKATML